MAQSVFPIRNYAEYPTHTTASRTSTTGLSIGTTVYNETSKKLEIWNGTLWYGFDGSFASGVVPWAADVFTFTGGAMNISTSSIVVAGKSMANGSAVATPTAGGTLTINSQALGSYDYVIKSGDQTVSSFTNSDWFTNTADTRSAFVVVQGNLTINSGQTFIPTNRKLFTCIYVTGNLSVGGGVSMSARGANHSGTGSSGGATTAAAIRIVTGTHTSVVNPEVPAAGGTGVASSTNGTAGTSGGTGSGGGGANDNTVASLHGASGTSFTGGSGGGGGRTYGGIGSPNAGGSGGVSGGAGGAALAAGGPYPSANPSSGGSGNPAGAGGEAAGGTGTGGVLFIIVEGTISGAGTIAGNGVNCPGASERPGGASGGGSVTVLYGTDSSTITPTATAGTGAGTYGYTTSGGAGTARKLAIA